MTQLDQLLHQEVSSWVAHRDLDTRTWASLPTIRQAAATATKGQVDPSAQEVLKTLGPQVADYEGIPPHRSRGRGHRLQRGGHGRQAGRDLA